MDTGTFGDAGNNNWVMENGDTLWGLARQLTGNGANWTKIGYTGNTNTMRTGTVINVSGMIGGGTYVPTPSSSPTQTPPTPPAPPPPGGDGGTIPKTGNGDVEERYYEHKIKIVYYYGYAPNGERMATYSGNFWFDESGFRSAMIGNAEFIYRYLRGKNWSKISICAVLGNMQVESSINPGNWENTYGGKNVGRGPGFGLVHWTADIRTFLFDWLNENGYQGRYDSMVGQVECLTYMMGLGGTYWNKWSKYPNYFMKVNDFLAGETKGYSIPKGDTQLGFLTKVFFAGFEKGTPLFDKRVAAAENWYKHFKNW